MEERFCPNCGSRHVEPDTENSAEVYFSGGNPNKWRCRDCEYVGLMPEGDPEEQGQEIQFDRDAEPERVDTGFGIGYLKYIVYVALPALAVYVIYLML